MEKEQDISLVSPVMNMKCRKILKGHRGRILHFDWSADQRHVITAGQVTLHNSQLKYMTQFKFHTPSIKMVPSPESLSY